MKIKSILIASAVAIAVSGQVQARGTATGTVESLTSSGSITNVFLSETITPVNGESIPSCATRDQNFALAADQKNQLAILLTALALGSEVRINGSDDCDVRDGTESVGSIRVLGD